MKRDLISGTLAIIFLLTAYSLFFPVPIDPVSWNPPPNPGYTGVFTVNQRLKGIEVLDIGNNHGPEDVAIDSAGLIYAATHEGRIVRLQPDGKNPENWVETGGRPLGICFDNNGNLIVADAFIGLLAIAPDKKITLLSSESDGKPILYADDVDVARDGKIYFSDASTKFGAKKYGGTYEASLFDVFEHGGHGRLLVYDPASKKTETLIDGLNFANGVALSHDETFVLINETGHYRVIRYWISGPKKGTSEPIIEALPGFPDNISRGKDGRYWVAFMSSRSKLLDMMADKPFLRKVSRRVPEYLIPTPKPYGHIIAIDGNGKVLQDLQDPDGAYRTNTAVTETEDYLFLGSLFMEGIGRISKERVGL